MEPGGYNGCYGVVLCQPNHHHATEYEVSSVKYIKKIYQKNLVTVHLNPIMAYTMVPYMQV